MRTARTADLELPEEPSNVSSGRMTVAGTGDVVIARKISQLEDPAFLDLVELLRSTDCAWGNCETVFLDTSKAYPSRKALDMHLSCAPSGADELAWSGFDSLGIANNHALDYGYDGLFSTMKHLDRVGIGYAGVGENLEDASQPTYVDTPVGRVGQVSCASFAPPEFSAEYASHFANGRPGINRLDVLTELDADSFDRLHGVYKELLHAISGQSYEPFGGALGAVIRKHAERENRQKRRLAFSGRHFTKGERTTPFNEVHAGQLSRITEALDLAKRNSHVTLLCLHAHEGAGDFESPAPFMQPFARACIDAGADVVFGTGPHLLRGIEIYRNRPIFYSLGNFMFQYGAVKDIPYEMLRNLGLDGKLRDPSTFFARYDRFFSSSHYWESVVPIITFEHGDVTEIKLYPIDLRARAKDSRRGTPVFAQGKTGKRIIDRLATLSAPYRTRIVSEEGVGRVELDVPRTTSRAVGGL